MEEAKEKRKKEKKVPEVWESIYRKVSNREAGTENKTNTLSRFRECLLFSSMAPGRSQKKYAIYPLQ
jgi:hypothetical protein